MDKEVELLGERIAEQAAHLDAATHRLLADVREFDARGVWRTQGASSCAHWLSWRVGWDLVTARERVRVARKLGEFPVTDDALRRGELSYSKVRAILRVATPANEAMLLECARMSTASELEKLSHKYARVQAHGKDPSPRDDEVRRYVRRRDTYDEMSRSRPSFTPRRPSWSGPCSTTPASSSPANEIFVPSTIPRNHALQTMNPFRCRPSAGARPMIPRDRTPQPMNQFRCHRGAPRARPTIPLNRSPYQMSRILDRSGVTGGRQTIPQNRPPHPMNPFRGHS